MGDRLKIAIRARARRDLDDILDYSRAAHGEAIAIAYLRSIDVALERLREFPELGIARHDLSPSMRSLPVGEHRIYYLAFDDRLSVVRVLHKAMNAERHLQQ